jgi:hypothetical protein
MAFANATTTMAAVEYEAAVTGSRSGYLDAESVQQFWVAIGGADAAARRHRNGAPRAGLQSHARHEYHRRPAAPGSDEGIIAADKRPSAVAEPPRTPASQSEVLPDEKPQNSGKSLHPATTPMVASRQYFHQGVFTRPRP